MIALMLLLCAVGVGARADELPIAIRLNSAATTIGVDSVNRSKELYIASANYASGNGPIPQSVSWTSSDPEMITLSPMAGDPSKCTITSTAAKAGSCTVTAKSGDAAASCVVTVRSLFPAKTMKIAGARTIQLGSDPTRNRLQLLPRITPAHASANDPWRELVGWKSSNSKIAVVDEFGCVQALKPGTVKITCGLFDGTKKRAAVTIKITQKAPKSINMSDQVVPMLHNIKLNYAIEPDDAHDQRVKWRSSDDRIAMVSSDGYVRGLKPGKVVISAMTAAGGKRASCTLTVVESMPSPSPSPGASPDPSASPSPSPSVSPSPSPSPSPTPSVPPKYRVHAIGNGTYLPSAQMTPLQSAESDAQTFADLYSAARFSDGGTAVNLHKNLTGTQMLTLFSGMSASGATADSVTIIYFQGHAMSSGEAARHGALMGVDGGIITVDELRQKLDAVPGKVVLVIDTNFSGRFLEESAQAATSMQRAVSRVFTGDKYKLICACSATGVVYDTGDLTSQTSLLMASIQAGLSGTLPADANRNGQVTLSELYQYAKASVDQLIDEMNRKYGLSLQQTVQVYQQGDTMAIYAK